FEFDNADGGYNLGFESMEHFEEWLLTRRRTLGVEFRRHTIEMCKLPPEARPWLTRATYRCTRDGDSRKTQYEPKHPGRKTKDFKKELENSCDALITVKTYPGTDCVLAKHRDEHSHPLGADNVPFMTLSKQVRGEIRQ
ncbi:hypothetical protein C8F01DRAFT_946911, partial [Mycena amicta]